MSPLPPWALLHFFATMRTSDFRCTFRLPPGLPVVPPYPVLWESIGSPEFCLYLDDVPRFDPADALVVGSRYCFPRHKRSAPTVLFCYRGSIPSRFRIAAHHLCVRFAGLVTKPQRNTRYSVPTIASEVRVLLLTGRAEASAGALVLQKN